MTYKMEFSQMVELFQRLEKTSSRLEMTSILSDFISEIPVDLLPTVLLFLRGGVFPMWSEKEIGIGDKLMIKVISNITNSSELEVGTKIKEKGDMGLAAEELLVNKTQTTLFRKELTVEKVRSSLDTLAEISGKNSQDKKLGYVSELLSMAEPVESRYLVRLILEELRLGVGEGIVRDAIASSFNVDVTLLERARSLTSDLGEVGRIARVEGNAGLEKISIMVGRPIEVMLAQKAENLEEILEKFQPAIFEIKYDGARVQVHKESDKVLLFTRRLENVTKQFPEIAESSRKGIGADSAIVEGELVAIISRGDRHPRPFQDLSRRIKRKHGINELVDEIPVEINLFDIVYHNGVDKIDEGFSDRRELLVKVVNESDNFRLAEHIATKKIKEATDFYEKAIEAGHEGVMAKNPTAPYKPGSRVGYMYKIKPVMETLDLAIVGATWGEGRRAQWMGSFLLGIMDDEAGKLLDVGRMGTGFTDQQFEEMTSLLKPNIISEEGKEIKLKPEIVVEVAYEEIQASPKYGSGYALRFPRLVRIRYDKGIGNIDTLKRLNSLIRKPKK